MKASAIFWVSTWHCLGILAAEFPLEWNATYPTDVPYEVELSPRKIGAASFAVLADGALLKTEVFEGRTPDMATLRFSVPSGTKSLVCRTSAGPSQMCDSSSIGNIFAGALDPVNLSRWSLPKGVTARKGDGGICLAADGKADQASFVTYSVPVPKGLAGKPAKLEMDVTNLSKLAWGGILRVQQLDADGEILPESLTDIRWISHMRPPGKLVQYREAGRIHPRASILRLKVALQRPRARFDVYGLPITDATDLSPSLLISRLSVRAAASLPFPKYDDAFFGAGASGAADDFSFRFGGAKSKAFWFQTRTRAGWSERYQFRNERDLAFPAGAGTVEAWFRPDWAALKASQRDKFGMCPVTLFDAWQGFRDAEGIQADRTMLRLEYDPVRRNFALCMRDWRDKFYKSDWKEPIDFPGGEWTHVAIQWDPEGEAELFVNGKKKAVLAIPEWQATPVSDKSIAIVNDLWAMEFFFGCSGESARLWLSPNKHKPFFEGEGDGLRVSFGRRYGDGFAPERRPAFDASTCSLFDFDRTFDGRCGGYGFVPGCVRAQTDRVDHRLKFADGRLLQYYPEEIAPDNDPFKVLNPLNYPVVATAQDHRASRIPRVKSILVRSGDNIAVDCPEGSVPDFVEISNKDGKSPLRYPILVSRGRMDPRSFGDLADSMRGLGLSDREKANKVFQYAISSSDYFMNHQVYFAPGSDSPRSACNEPMTMLNSYCGFECGPLNNLAANMFVTVAGCPASAVRGYAHAFQEVFFDGKNHIYDLSWQRFFPAMDNETSAGLAEMEDEPGIFNRMRMSPDHFVRKGSRGHGVQQSPTYVEKCAMTLNPGETFRIRYANDGQMNNLQSQVIGGRWGRKTIPKDAFDYTQVAGAKSSDRWTLRIDRIFPHYSTGVLSFDGVPSLVNSAFAASGDGAFTYHVRSCYPIVWADYAAYLADGTSVPLEVSTNGGRSWRALPSGTDGGASLEYMVKARHDYLIRIMAPVASVKRFVAHTECEVNPRTYPGFLQAGENELAFKALSQDPALVSLGWRERTKEIVFEGALASGTLPGFERALVLLDPSRPLEVPMKGASTAAKTRTYGRISAAFNDGVLTLAYDRQKLAAFRHGDDLPEPVKEFPAFAAVDVIDGGAVKTLTVIVSPGAHLLRAVDAKVSGGARLVKADEEAVQDRIHFVKRDGRASFVCPQLPGGRYLVLALARFPAHKKGVRINMVDPSDAKKKYRIARDENPMVDYLDACYGQKGGRSRWKWDCAGYGEEWKQGAKAWSLRRWDFQSGLNHLDFTVEMDDGLDAELAGILILPEPDNESLCEIVKVLFGLNCDPFHI